MINLNNLTISKACKKLKNKIFTSVELTEIILNNIKNSNNNLNAYVNITFDKAIKMAKNSDKNIFNNNAKILEGIPIGIKDTFAVKNVHTQACSNILKGFLPNYESTVTSNLWLQGAVMLGKLNMDEFAMGSTNSNSCYGNAINPWKKKMDNQQLVPGGSSGGAAVAVSADLCMGALASDTGGSIRQPASFTGTVGIKPTYGRCSRWGMISYASSLDQAGIITKTVLDSAIMLKAISSFDKKDMTSANVDIPKFEEFIKYPIKNIKIGIPINYYEDNNLNKDIKITWQKSIDYFQYYGIEIVMIDIPYIDYLLPSYYTIALVEASSNLSRYDGIRYGLRKNDINIDNMYKNTRSEGFGAEVKKRILLGNYMLCNNNYNSYYKKAQKIRDIITNEFSNLWNKGIEAILTPTTTSVAFPINEINNQNNSLEIYKKDIFTVIANMTGLPAISIPAGLNQEGLPIGLQIIGKPFDEFKLFRIAQIIEDTVGILKPKNKWWI